MVAIEPLAYRTIIGTALQALRPRVEMIVVESDALLAEVPRLKPGLVISEFSRPSESSEIAWIEFPPYNKALARVMYGERCSLLYEPHLNDLLSLTDEAERLSEESTPFCPTTYEMK